MGMWKRKMRVCPKCGFMDDALWRNSIRPLAQFMPLSDFKLIEPNIAKAVTQNDIVIKEPFQYHLTKGLNVERIAIIDAPSSKAPFEATPKSKMKSYSRILHSHKRDYGLQKKIGEFLNVGT